jgi:hypothetical protein
LWYENQLQLILRRAKIDKKNGQCLWYTNTDQNCYQSNGQCLWYTNTDQSQMVNAYGTQILIKIAVSQMIKQDVMFSKSTNFIITSHFKEIKNIYKTWDDILKFIQWRRYVSWCPGPVITITASNTNYEIQNQLFIGSTFI